MGVVFGGLVTLAINTLPPEEAASYPAAGFAAMLTFAGFLVFGYLMGLMSSWIDSAKRAHLAGGIAFLPLSVAVAFMTNQQQRTGAFMYMFAVVYSFIIGGIGGQKLWKYFQS